MTGSVLIQSIVSRIAAVWTTLAASSGAGLLGWIQSGAGAVKRWVQDKLRERISVMDFGAVGDGVTDDTVAIKAAITRAVAIGASLLFPGTGNVYLISDTLTIGSNVRLIFEGSLKLNAPTSTGTVLYIAGSNVEVVNPLIDVVGTAVSTAGENGIGIVSGANIHVWGGKIKNAARGGTGNMFGGKAIQVESGAVDGVTVVGTEMSNCFMAMSVARDGGTVPDDFGVQFSDIKADTCSILLLVKQTNLNDTAGLKTTVQLNGFYAVNCGGFEGVMQFSRAAHVQVSNGVVVNDPAVVASTPLIQGNHRYCTFENIDFSGNCDHIIGLDPTTFAVDQSNPCVRNTYDIRHIGTTQYVAYSSVTTTNRTLGNSVIDVVLDSDVGTKIAGDELRNAYCLVRGQQGSTSIEVSTANLYLQGLAKFSSFGAGHNVYAGNVGLYKANAAAAPGAFTDVSGAGLTLTTGYYDYSLNGRICTVAGRIVWPTTADTSAAKIGGLPFAAANNSSRINSGFALSITNYGAALTGRVLPGASAIDFYTMASVSLKNSDLSGKTVDFTLTYFIS